MRRIVFRDTFGQASIAGHWTDADEQSEFANAALASAKARFVHDGTAGAGFARITYENVMPTSDVAVQAILQASDAASWVAVAGRLGGVANTDDANGGYYAVLALNDASFSVTSWPTIADSTVYLLKRDPSTGIISSLGSATVAVGAATDAVLRLVLRGSSIEVWVDGALYVSATDTAVTRAGYVAVGGATSTANATIDADNFQVSHLAQNAAVFSFAALDEARGHIWFVIPSAGSEQPGKQYLFDTRHEELYERDHTLRGFGQYLDSRGEIRLCLGTADGFVLVVDDATQWAGADFTGTWESNWIDPLDAELHKRLTLWSFDLVKQATNVAFTVTISATDHPDSTARAQKLRLHSAIERQQFLATVGGRWIKVKVEHTGNGDLEVRAIKAQIAEPRPAVPGLWGG